MVDRRKLQVFVSSTYTDLIEERQTAVAAILKAGHIPAGMELFTSGDKSQLDVIKRWIDQSDVYMLILGTRYGSIEPVSKLGYTEVEFDYAVSTGKPFFSLVMGDSAIDAKLKSGGASVAEKKNTEKLNIFREKVLSRMCSIFEDARDIKASIYESLIDYSQQPGLEGWVRGGLAVDVRPLYDQIADLTDSNERLRGELSALRQSQTSDPDKGHDVSTQFVQLRSVLDNMELTIPADIAQKGKELRTTVFKMLVTNKNIYVRGVSISPATSERNTWFETNVYPPLITHRVMMAETRPDGSRHYAITDLGLDFSAWIDLMGMEATRGQI